MLVWLFLYVNMTIIELPHTWTKNYTNKGLKNKSTIIVVDYTSQSNHTRTTAVSNSMKLSHARGATQDRWVMVERSDRMWSTGEGNGKPRQYFCLENPKNSMKRQNDKIPKEELPRSLGAQYATGDQWRNNSRKNEGMEPKQKQYPAVDGTGDRSKVWSCKEQCCIGTWNVRSMNQCKL